MDLLARREHTRLELTHKLKSRIEENSLLDAVLDELVDENLLSHERFCEAFVFSRTNKGYGPVRIKSELRERGVDASIVETYLHEEPEAWIEGLRKVIIKKYGSSPDNSYQQQAKQKRFLLQRGFTFEQIHVALNSLSE